MDQALRSRRMNSFATRRKQLEQCQQKLQVEERRAQYIRSFYNQDGQQQQILDITAGSRLRKQRNNMPPTTPRGRGPTVVTLTAFATEDDCSIQEPRSRSRSKPQPLPLPLPRSVDSMSISSSSSAAAAAAAAVLPPSGPRIFVPETPLGFHSPVAGGPPSSSSLSPHLLPLSSLAAGSPEDWTPDHGYSRVMAQFTLLTPSSQQATNRSLRSTPSPEFIFTSSDHDDSSVPELEEDFDDDDLDNECDSSDHSLLEIAQPVSYHLPKVRPSVVSIGSRASSKEWKTLPSERELMGESPALGPRPSTRHRQRASTSSAHSGFMACEAQLLEIPDKPDTTPTATTTMNNTTSTKKNTTSAYTYTVTSRPKHSHTRSAYANIHAADADADADAPLPSNFSIKKSGGHRRMNSIKSMIKSSSSLSRTSSIHTTGQQGPSSAVNRPSTAIADIFDDNYNPFETVPADLFSNGRPPTSTSSNRYVSRHIISSSSLSRPATASTNPTPAATFGMPAAAASPTPESITTTTSTTTGEHGEQGDQSATLRARRKSMKGLRKRGESIGQAFKMAALMAMGSSKGDAAGALPPPPVPAISLQQQQPTQ